MKETLRYVSVTVILPAAVFCVATTSAMAGECDKMINPVPAAEDYRGQRIVVLNFHKPPNCNDVINIRWATPGGRWQQVGVDPSPSCIPYSGNCSYLGLHANPDKPYMFEIQSCRTRALASSVCSPWSAIVHYLPYGPDTCQDGYVWREASSSDHVCVRVESRNQAKQDNAQARTRVSPTDHAYGPDTCIGGFVWREAFAGDHVCVTSETRARTKAENNESAKHLARNWH